MNTGSGSVDLFGLIVSDDGSDLVTIDESFELAPGAYAVLGSKSTDNGGYTPDVTYNRNDLVLGIASDELVLSFIRAKNRRLGEVKVQVAYGPEGFVDAPATFVIVEDLATRERVEARVSADRQARAVGRLVVTLP